MFNCGVPEKVAAENTGHRSTKALRCYEKTTDELQQVVSEVISDSCNPDCLETHYGTLFHSWELVEEKENREYRPSVATTDQSHPIGTFSSPIALSSSDLQKLAHMHTLVTKQLSDICMHLRMLYTFTH